MLNGLRKVGHNQKRDSHKQLRVFILHISCTEKPELRPKKKTAGIIGLFGVIYGGLG